MAKNDNAFGFTDEEVKRFREDMNKAYKKVHGEDLLAEETGKE